MMDMTCVDLRMMRGQSKETLNQALSVIGLVCNRARPYDQQPNPPSSPARSPSSALHISHCWGSFHPKGPPPHPNSPAHLLLKLGVLYLNDALLLVVADLVTKDIGAVRGCRLQSSHGGITRFISETHVTTVDLNDCISNT